ncbi:MAG: glycosyltransferase [Thermaerobacter sp.]|nr:glycosyltransferase [Thermaerobacter sp.]
MRILYLLADPGIPVPGHKGASTHVMQMVRAFRAAGANVILLTARPGTYPVPDLAPVCVAATSPGPRRAHLLTMMENAADKLLKTFPADALYERYSLFGEVGLRLGKRYGLPLYLEVNAPLTWEETAFRGLPAQDAPAAQAAERRIWLGATRLFAVSSPLADYAKSLGVPADRITVAPNGFDPALFYPGGAPAALPLWPPSVRHVVGFVGSLKPWHGVDLLLKALAHRAEWAAVLVGEGPERSALAALAEKLGLTARVWTVGAVPLDQVRAYYAAMDLVVAPYRPHPDMPFYFSPLKIIEAMAAGRAVLAPALGDIPHWLGQGRGLLFQAGDVADLARQLAAAPSWPLKAMGRQAAEWVSRTRTWQSVADRALAQMRGRP